MKPLLLTFTPLALLATPPDSMAQAPLPALETNARLLTHPEWTLGIILLLLGLSALVSAAATGYAILAGREKAGIPDAVKHRKIRDNLRNPGQLRSTIVVLNLLINVIIIMLIVRLAIPTLLPGLPSAGMLVLLVILISLVILLSGVVLPKIIGHHYPVQVASLMAYPLALMGKILTPLTYLLQRSSYSAEQKSRKNQKNISVDEISQALELTSGNDITEEKEILRGIVNFGNKTADEIMVPRVDVVSIDIKSSFTAVLEIINTSGYSRIPVYSESFDQVRGILYIKDLLPYTEKGEEFQWQNLLRPPFFVPETKKVKDLLEEFQKNKIHMAIVVDEYGGSSGIVTLEDVLEEIVGDIADEFDEDETFYTRLGDKKFLFDGKTLLEQFCDTVGCDKDIFHEVRGEADTLAGLILEIKGDIPTLHENIEYGQFRFTIESVTNRRIRQIRTELL
ncbi:MAG TPA: gliding motility-associated protein GldE [Prolixibacteraceae bacterium]|nr:gliding motility-associated protein GldE [Prolixibacteraceae bacterium]